MIEALEVCRVGEVAVAHRLCRCHRFADVGDGVLDVLQSLLETREEEELVAVLVEFGARNKHRPADIGAEIVVAVVRFGQLKVLHPPICVVQNMVTHCPVEFAVEILSARLGFRLKHDRPARVIRGERGGFHFNFLDHLHIGRYGRGPGRVDVGDWRSIAHDLGEVEAVAVHTIGACVLGKASGLAAITVAVEIAGVRRSGYQAKQFESAASFNVQALHLLGGKSIGNLARSVGRNRHRSCRDVDRLVRGPHSQVDVGDLRVVGDMHDDPAPQVGKARLFELYLIGGGGQAGERKKAVRIAGGRLGSLVRGVGQSDGHARHYSPSRIFDGAG